MAINRGPWSALTDDDGSNLVGSIWNKAAIATVLLDPIDTLVGPWVDVPFAAGDFTASAGTWTVTAGQVLAFRYQLIGKAALVHVAIEGATISGASPVRLFVTLPAAIRTTRKNGVAFAYLANSTVAGVGNAGTGTLYPTQLDCVRDIAGTPWPAGGGVYLYITTILALP